MATFQPASNLRSQTYIGLLIAQFLAAFNDQAIHASAMFFALRKQTLNEATAIALMPILFYAPWALFCTLAGYLADRYSKRNSLIFWKVAEIGITGIALAGFWAGTHGLAWGPWLVLSTVFLMGMHSAFFVPAKYGVMPEILKPEMLSRGNGLLESLSFLAIILGTVLGGVLSTVFHDDREYLIGLTLFVLALLGAGASLLIRRMPAANPSRAFPPWLYLPLLQNIRDLLRSRPCAFAVIGIAFFTFIVAFMRATVYMFGESQVPRWTEQETSIVVGMVALGIGLGSPLVGFLSGRKVELGLVPVGAVGMVAATAIAAFTLRYIPGLVGCIIAIGFFTGFYIVPLFTLLQHRAPKTSKGDAIATSNFINVTGAILASLVFFGMDFAAKRIGLAPELTPLETITGTLTEEPEFVHGRPARLVIDGREFAKLQGQQLEIRAGFGEQLGIGDRVVNDIYQIGNTRVNRFRPEDRLAEPKHDKRGMPRLLFLSAAAMTLLTLLLLWGQLPDLWLRTWLWFRWRKNYRLEVDGLLNLPGTGPAILVTNANSSVAALQVLSVTDRTTRLLRVDEAGDWDKLTRKARQALQQGRAVALWSADDNPAMVESLADVLAKGGPPAPVLAVYRDVSPARRDDRQRVRILFGNLLPAGTPTSIVVRELRQLGETLKNQEQNGSSLTGRAVAATH
jgi:MFS family permease